MRSTVFRRNISGSENRPFIVGISFIFLFAIAVMTAIITITSLQVTKGAIYDAAMVQLMIGMAGFGLGFFFVKTGIVKFEPRETYDSLWSWNNGWIVWGIIGFAGIRIVNLITQGVYIPKIELTMSTAEVLNIVLSAGVFEDTLLSLGFCTILYLGWKAGPKQLITRHFGSTVALVIGMLFVSIISAWVFSAMHIGAGYTEAQLGYVFMSRIVLSLVYLRSKNLMAPVSAHMLHNLLLFLLGV